jgi:hypothetical protein
MNVMNKSFDWLREMKPELKQLDSIPLTGFTPDFSWETFSANLAAVFNKTIAIQADHLLWRSADELLIGISNDVYPMAFSITSLEGLGYWMIDREELKRLMAYLLTDERVNFPDDEAFLEGFVRFISLEVVSQLGNEAFFKDSLIPVFSFEKELPIESALCRDLKIKIDERTFVSRLVLTSKLQKSWAQHFSTPQPSAQESEIAKSISLAMHLEAGRVALSFEEWSKIRVGDCILLDNCTLDLEAGVGDLILSIEGKQLHRAELRNDQIEIL